jgi:putative transposase
MPIPQATPIEASERTQQILDAILRRRTAPLWLVTRVKIIVRAVAGWTNTAIAEELGLDRITVRLWRHRWHENTARRVALEEAAANEQELEAFIIDSLRDAYRSGTPPKFSAEQVVQIVALACEDPQASGYPVSHWTPREVAAEAIKRGIVESISERQVGRFLKRG